MKTEDSIYGIDCSLEAPSNGAAVAAAAALKAGSCVLRHITGVTRQRDMCNIDSLGE